ncbi:MAG: hypothetical protein WBQ25_22095 [Nitrososphaeraceae archaeon]
MKYQNELQAKNKDLLGRMVVLVQKTSAIQRKVRIHDHYYCCYRKTNYISLKIRMMKNNAEQCATSWLWLLPK